MLLLNMQQGTDREELKNLFNEFLESRINHPAIGIKSGDQWIKERKETYEFYRDKFSPSKINELTKKDFHFFLTFRGNKSWTNLPRGCMRVTSEFEKLKESLIYLQNESLSIKDRVNELMRGKFHIRGFGKNLVTGLLHIFNWQKYGVWNNRSEKVLDALGRLPFVSSDPGESYVRINSELCRMANEIETDLVYLDGFLWWLDEFRKLSSRDFKSSKACRIKLNAQVSIPIPSIQDLKEAHNIFIKREPRALFYKVARELVDLALSKKTSISISEALGVLLQTWNKAFYRYTLFDEDHLRDIENLLNANNEKLMEYRERNLNDLSDDEEPIIKEIFESFEKVTGPVGAAKALHLLAPEFFPLWDRTIAKAYNIPLRGKGTNKDQYFKFMKITKQQCNRINAKDLEHNTLKLLDEFNYCKFTKKWI